MFHQSQKNTFFVDVGSISQDPKTENLHPIVASFIE
jgi:hypothetical protein